ncbi:MAG: hypothetical protein KKF12_05400 [Proteobacteria bacterium]|nr:hypothetical protein [Desulfobacula sp.]MBU3953333.1 hypothetical protein [Pseudomonadota bacterium]MBU4130235.1 hypothetical protein [Pseudomonadota bacterium]
MEFELDSSHEKYIKITITGLIVKPELISVMAQLLQHPEYLDKHTLWDLREANMGLSIGDLKEIIGVLRLYKPQKKDFANKTALFVPGKFNSAMAEMFVAMSKLLPIKYRVFNDLKQAESYLCS